MLCVGFCRILIKKSHGVPSWCEQLLCEMMGDEVIQVVPDDDRTEGMTIPPATSLLQKKLSDQEIDEVSDHRLPITISDVAPISSC